VSLSGEALAWLLAAFGGLGCAAYLALTALELNRASGLRAMEESALRCRQRRLQALGRAGRQVPPLDRVAGMSTLEIASGIKRQAVPPLSSPPPA